MSTRSSLIILSSLLVFSSSLCEQGKPSISKEESCTTSRNSRPIVNQGPPPLVVRYFCKENSSMWKRVSNLFSSKLRETIDFDISYLMGVNDLWCRNVKWDDNRFSKILDGIIQSGQDKKVYGIHDMLGSLIFNASCSKDESWDMKAQRDFVYTLLAIKFVINDPLHSLNSFYYHLSCKYQQIIHKGRLFENDCQVPYFRLYGPWAFRGNISRNMISLSEAVENNIRANMQNIPDSGEKFIQMIYLIVGYPTIRGVQHNNMKNKQPKNIEMKPVKEPKKKMRKEQENEKEVSVLVVSSPPMSAVSPVDSILIEPAPTTAMQIVSAVGMLREETAPEVEEKQVDPHYLEEDYALSMQRLFAESTSPVEAEEPVVLDNAEVSGSPAMRSVSPIDFDKEVDDSTDLLTMGTIAQLFQDEYGYSREQSAMMQVLIEEMNRNNIMFNFSPRGIEFQYGDKQYFFGHAYVTTNILNQIHNLGANNDQRSLVSSVIEPILTESAPTTAIQIVSATEVSANPHYLEEDYLLSMQRLFAEATSAVEAEESVVLENAEIEELEEQMKELGEEAKVGMLRAKIVPAVEEKEKLQELREEAKIEMLRAEIVPAVEEKEKLQS